MHINNELLLKFYDIDLKIFNVKNNFSKLVRSNLKYQLDLEKYKDVIFNTDSLTWRILDDIKIIELEINLKNSKMSRFLITKLTKCVI